ncbi:MAG TPA: hypothetical protein VGN83_26490 [Falsiroseomonas sp.]|jgi:hypothetical protein|nr:hypothetical protein [Falsiroseomonas sp.]
MNVSELADGDQVKKVLQAYAAYRTAVSKDPLSMAAPEARLPKAEVFYNSLTTAVVIILPERHDSDVADVQDCAEVVAKHVLLLKKVKIAVEEPVELSGGLLISNVGFAGDITSKPATKSLFDFAPSARGSISHQILARQISSMLVGVKRFAAEAMPRNPRRYNNPEINETMAKNLNKNAGRGEAIVFPVGPDHLSASYDLNTLISHMTSMGWSSVGTV